MKTRIFFILLILCFIFPLVGQEELYPICIETKNLDSSSHKTVLYGFMNSTGSIIIEPIYRNVQQFNEELSLVEFPNGNKEFINKLGEKIIDCSDYSFIDSFSESLLIVRSKNKIYSVLDIKGNVVFSLENKIRITRSFNEGLATVKKDGRYGFINTAGKIVIPCNYTDAYSFSEGLARVKKDDDKYHFISLNGDDLFNISFQRARSFNCGLAAVKEHDLWGYIDNSGKYVIDPIYSLASDFSNGIALVESNENYIFIDKENNVLFNCSKNGFVEATSFNEYGYSFLKTKDNTWIVVDRAFNQVFPYYFSKISFYNGIIGLFFLSLENNDIFGPNYPSQAVYIDKNGKLVSPFKIVP